MSREDLHFRLRLPEQLKKRIEEEAAISCRSMTAEIVARLQASFHSTPTTLVGMFFLRDNGDTYLTGEIIAEINGGIYLLKPDNMKDMPVDPPHEVMSIEQMTGLNEYDIPSMQLFSTREAMTAWIDWIEKPSEPRIVNLVKK